MTIAPPDPDLLAIPHWVKWLAQDSDGVWWGYSVEPLRNDHGWYENEVGNIIRLGSSRDSGWESSLRKVDDQACCTK